MKKLGVVSDKSESQFVGALGRPSLVKTLGSGQRLLEWRSGRFSSQMIVVLFDRDHRFVEVVARYPRARANRGQPVPKSVVSTRSVRSQLADLDLRDTRVEAGKQRGLWARSPR